MSLIDEALKRAEMEAARRDGLRGGAYPWVPEHHTKRRRPWVIVAAVVIATGIVAGGVMWLSSRPAPVQSPESKVQGLRSKVQSSPSQELQTVEVAPPPRGQPSRVTTGDAEAASPKGGEEAKRPAPKPPADAAHARTAPAAESRPASAAAAEGKAARGPAEGKTYVGEITVPDGGKIELGGIAYSEVNPVALINGQVLGPGAVVEEFMIVSIQPDRVELRGRGMTVFLALK
jgi:hypothetical protein